MRSFLLGERERKTLKDKGRVGYQVCIRLKSAAKESGNRVLVSVS